MQNGTSTARQLQIIFVSAALLAGVGCGTVKTAYNTAYYATAETFGVHKRDILKKRVASARDEQKQAGEQFQDALTKLKAMYAFDGGEIEKHYKQLESEYKESEAKAEAVRDRITGVEAVAGALFEEWEREIEEIQTVNLKVKSKSAMLETKTRYNSLVTALKKAEASMDPVLTKFKDHVLFLKHNLNAAAIASLKGEAINIQEEITKLIADMNTSIARADEFIRNL